MISCPISQSSILVVTVKNNKMTKYLMNALDNLAEYCDYTLDIEDIDKLNLEDSQHQVVIFDHIPIRSMSYDILKVSNIGNLKPFYAYVNKDMTQDDIDLVLRNGFDYLIDGSFLNSSNFCLRIVNILRKHFEINLKNDLISFDNFTINTIDRKIWKCNDLIRLTNLEFNLLVLLIKNANKIVSQETIFKYVWDTDDEDRTRVVTQYIHRLKNKIGKEYIKSVSSKGYIFSPLGNKKCCHD